MMSQQSNQAYWTRRFLTVKAKQLKNTEDYERTLQPELNGLFREFQSEFESWYVKYANNEGISKEDAAKLLQNIDTKHWEITLKQFEEKAKAGGFDQELNSIYYRSRIARLQSLEKQLQQLAERFASQETNHFRNALTKQYDDTYMRTTYNLQAATANVTSNFAHFNEAQLRIVVSEPWGKDGKDFSKRIWRNYRKEMPSMLMDTVLRGTLLGYSEPKIAQMFHARFQDVEKNNIHRLVITEMAHVQEEATAKGYEENEIEEYEYMATLESHTCEVCAKLDGQRFKVSEREPGVNYPPIHARCRCTTVPWIKGLPETKERWMRDPQTGKGKLIKNMKFDEWKKLTDIK
ncbi:minor capsid protein [Lentilactobacillus hilgardii]|uniref:minor capsid protein n=1 Tax=Lentilactobacillus hilgardii TaxID=1588 RepID=UPI00390C748E